MTEPRLYEPPGDDEPLDDIQRALVEALLPTLIHKVREAMAGRPEPGRAVTADEFEAAYAQRSGTTVEVLRAHGRVVRPCHCGDELCGGWQSVSQENAADLDEHGTAA